MIYTVLVSNESCNFREVVRVLADSDAEAIGRAEELLTEIRVQIPRYTHFRVIEREEVSRHESYVWKGVSFGDESRT